MSCCASGDVVPSYYTLHIDAPGCFFLLKPQAVRFPRMQGSLLPACTCAPTAFDCLLSRSWVVSFCLSNLLQLSGRLFDCWWFSVCALQVGKYLCLFPFAHPHCSSTFSLQSLVGAVCPQSDSALDLPPCFELLPHAAASAFSAPHQDGIQFNVHCLVVFWAHVCFFFLL